MITLDHVTRTYPVGGGLTVLDSVCLHVAEGEYVGILGPSGSGKSTLLHLVGLLDRPTSGRVLFRDTDVGTLSDAALSMMRGRTIGFVFQSFHLVSQLTVLENVELPLFYQRIPRGERRRRAGQALEEVGLGPRAGHLPTQLSGGECQRTAIARAVVTNPDLVLADEPTGNLDSGTGRDIMAVFDRLHRAGRTLIMITHDQAIADALPRVERMQDGRFVT